MNVELRGVGDVKTQGMGDVEYAILRENYVRLRDAECT